MFANAAQNCPIPSSKREGCALRGFGGSVSDLSWTMKFARVYDSSSFFSFPAAARSASSIGLQSASPGETSIKQVLADHPTRPASQPFMFHHLS